MICKRQIKTGSKPCDHYIALDQLGEPGLCSLPNMFRCPVALFKKGIRLSHSSVQDFLRCKHLWKLKHIDGILIKPYQNSVPMKLGTLWDKCNDIIYGLADQDSLKTLISDLSVDLYDVARVRACLKAFSSLELKIEHENLVGLQQEFFYKHVGSEHVTIHGFYDRLYTDHFVECKFSSSPDFYLSPFELASQIGTYFLANKSLDYVTMEIVRRPTQSPYKVGSKHSKNETPKEFYNRLHMDILSRPSHYFIGLNRRDWTYGKKFYRDEFDLKELAERYEFILSEIKDCVKRGSFYKNNSACRMFGSVCEYQPICKIGAVSETVFEYKGKEQ